MANSKKSTKQTGLSPAQMRNQWVKSIEPITDIVKKNRPEVHTVDPKVTMRDLEILLEMSRFTDEDGGITLE